jgi:hypothetical protein
MYVYLDKVKEQMQGDSNEPHRLMYDSWKRCMVNLTDGIRDDHEKVPATFLILLRGFLGLGSNWKDCAAM